MIKSAISGQIIDFYFFSIFPIFFHLFQQMLIVGLLRCGWVLWRPKMVILNNWVQFNLYLSHFEQLEPNIQTKRLCSLRNEMSSNCKNRGHPLTVFTFLTKWPMQNFNWKNWLMYKWNFFYHRLHKTNLIYLKYVSRKYISKNIAVWHHLFEF